MSEERSKPGVLSWVSLFLGLFLLYLLSAIPISWMINNGFATNMGVQTSAPRSSGLAQFLVRL